MNLEDGLSHVADIQWIKHNDKMQVVSKLGKCFQNNNVETNANIDAPILPFEQRIYTYTDDKGVYICKGS